MPRPLYVERALFIVGEPDDGKSTQLRSLFGDRRYGTNGKIPTDKKIPETYFLSHDRRLYLRLTSPHEYGETPNEFFKKVREKTVEGRWVIASPLQPEPRNKMPGVVETVELFVREFSPERVRVCLLSPGQSGNTGEHNQQAQFDELWNIDSVECVILDARTRERNGLIYADFFDFS
jgi:hypothetical protein